MKYALLSLALLACGDDGGGEPPLFPEDYAATYQEVRTCRNSLEHDLRRIRVLASPEALAPYQNRTDPFPAGAVVLKVEYDDSDTTCSEAPIGFTVMKRLAVGADPGALDWQWQELDGGRKALGTPPAKCINCHESCVAPVGYLGTCTDP